MRDLLGRLMLMLHGERRHMPRTHLQRAEVMNQQRRVATRLAGIMGATPDDVLREAARRSQRRVAR